MLLAYGKMRSHHDPCPLCGLPCCLRRPLRPPARRDAEPKKTLPAWIKQALAEKIKEDDEKAAGEVRRVRACA